MTNYEKIKDFSVEEMTEFLEKISEMCSFKGHCCGSCPLRKGVSCTKIDIEKWLQSEVEDE